MKNKSVIHGLYGLALITVMSANMFLNSTFISSPKIESKYKIMDSSPKYTKKFTYVNNDSIKDIMIMKGPKINEIWYGIKRYKNSPLIYMTKKNIDYNINFGEIWNLEPKKDIILENFKKRTRIY